jgi:ParB-like chromosome segregation protein Spo0J
VNEEELINELESHFDSLDSFEDKVEFLNKIRRKVHSISPFEEPIDCVQWVKQQNVEGNDYNPNEVASPEMELLHKSIKEDGYTQPIVTFEVDEDQFEVVDGFHRTLVGKEKSDIRDRLDNYLPVTVIDKPREERMGSTIRHNRARGTHQIREISNLVVELAEEGWSDDRISDELGMELDEVIRLKQVSGLKKAFDGHEFSQSWTAFEEKYYGEKSSVKNERSDER